MSLSWHPGRNKPGRCNQFHLNAMEIKRWLNSPFTAQHLATFTAGLTQIRSNLPAFINMNDKDIQSCWKAGNPQIAMLLQISRAAKVHPNVMPGLYDLTDFFTKVETINTLLQMEEELKSMREGLHNCLTGAADEALRVAIEYYHALGRASRASSRAGLREIYRDIKDNFKNSTGKTPEEAYPEEQDTDAPNGGNAKIPGNEKAA